MTTKGDYLHDHKTTHPDTRKCTQTRTRSCLCSYVQYLPNIQLFEIKLESCIFKFMRHEIVVTSNSLLLGYTCTPCKQPYVISGRKKLLISADLSCLQWTCRLLRHSRVFIDENRWMRGNQYFIPGPFGRQEIHDEISNISIPV
jgi:hypothetical protein